MAVAVPNETGFSRAIYIVWGILMIVAGLFLWARPATTSLVLVEIMAIFWIVGGIFDFIRAIADKPDYYGWRIAGAIIGIIAGLYIIGNPLLGTMFTIQIAFLLLAIYGIVGGILNIIGGIRGEGTRWSAVIIGAMLVLIAGWLLFHWQSAILTFVPVLAIFMVVGGIFSIIASFYIDQAGVIASNPAAAPAPAATTPAPAATPAPTTETPAGDSPPAG